MQLGQKQGLHKGTLQLGRSGAEEIHFARDMDLRQIIYPTMSSTSSRRSTSASEIVRGPNPSGIGKGWKVFGEPGEEIAVEIEIENGRIAVGISGHSMGS